MLYLLHMNKEVIYLEPEDDITDILTKLQRADQKLVALVPPKKATMLRSAVNMKLVARAAKESKKVAVIVTSDPAIVKLAMTAQIPVAKTLQSRPVVPTPEMLKSSANEEQVIDEDLAETAQANAVDRLDRAKNAAKKPAEASNSASERSAKESANTIDLTEEGLEKGSKDPKKAKKAAANGKDGAKGQKVPNFEKYRKWIILGAVAAVFLVVFGVWAFVFAPAVKITVAMSTSASNFAESVHFTENEADQNIPEGVFYAQKLTYEDKFETNFTATGQEERGDKAQGSLTVSYTLSADEIKNALGEGMTVVVPEQTEFVAGNGLSYFSTEAVEISWDGKIGSDSECHSSNSCKLSATVPIVAANIGASYDVSKSTTWEVANASFTAVSATAVDGGSSKSVTVVTQADVNKAAEKRDNNEAAGKAELLAKVTDAQIPIEPSYQVEVGDLQPSPAVGSEVTEGTQPKLSAVTTYSIYVVDKAAVEEYIKDKTEIADDQRIYSIGEPYFERFTNINEASRLKTVIKVGPTVTEENIRERAKGRKIGEVQSLLRSINGVSSVEIQPSFFWVRSVPNDDNKVTVELTVEDNE